jgi:hypothetical protein
VTVSAATPLRTICTWNAPPGVIAPMMLAVMFGIDAPSYVVMSEAKPAKLLSFWLM